MTKIKKMPIISTMGSFYIIIDEAWARNANAFNKLHGYPKIGEAELDAKIVEEMQKRGEKSVWFTEHNVEPSLGVELDSILSNMVKSMKLIEA